MMKKTTSFIVRISASNVAQSHRKMAILTSLAFYCTTVKLRTKKYNFRPIDKLEDAVSAFERMLRMEPKPDVARFNEHLDIIVKMKEYPVALSLFDKMRQEDVPISDYTINTLINCYALFNCIDLSFAMVGLLLKTGYVPTAITFGTLLKGLFLANDVNGATLLFMKVVENKLCEPNEMMYLTMVYGICDAGKPQAAIDLIEKYNGNARAYNMVIDSLCKNGNISYALNLFSRMIENGPKPTIVTYTILIAGYCKIGKIDEAWRLFLEIPCVGIEYNTFTYSAMLKGLFDAGRCTEAMKLFHEMEMKVLLNIVNYTIVTDGLCKNNRATEAFSVVSLMEEKGLNPDIVMYTALIQALCKNGDIAAAKYIFNKLPTKGLKPSGVTFKVIVDGLRRQGWLGEADHYAKKMKEMECLPNNVTYKPPRESIRQFLC